MIDVNDLRKGVTFLLDGNLFKVLEYSHNKPGRGNARDVRKGNTLEKTFQSGDRVQDVHLDFRNLQYLYRDGDMFTFMDMQTFDQPSIKSTLVGDYAGLLKEGMEVKLTYYDNEPIDIELPTSVDLEVVQAEVSVRGDTATNLTKKVTTETGLEVQVPNFVNVGDTIRIDTRTNSYLTRV
jgi:elongation factor P